MRLLLFLINGLGVGSLPDYSKFEEEYYNTLKNIENQDELAFLQKLGLFSLLDFNTENTIGLTARGRMLSTILDYDAGESEILGNLTFDDNVKPRENILQKLNDNNINTLVLSSELGEDVDIVYNSDKEMLDKFNLKNIIDNSFVMFRLNDFAKNGLCGDKNLMQQNLKIYNDSLQKIIESSDTNDLIMIVGNYGVNVEKMSISREYSPIVLYSKSFISGDTLNTVQGNNCVAYTIADLFDVYPNDFSLARKRIKDMLENDFQHNAKEKIADYFDKIFDDINLKIKNRKKVADDKQLLEKE